MSQPKIFIKDTLKSISKIILFICFIGLGFYLLFFGMSNINWLSEVFMPIAFRITEIVIIFNIIVILPLMIFRKTRLFASYIMGFSSFVTGFTMWIWSFILTYFIWGGVILVIALLFIGIGVLPTAIVGVAIEGKWDLFGELLLLLIITIIFRNGSQYIGQKEEDRRIIEYDRI